MRLKNYDGVEVVYVHGGLGDAKARALLRVVLKKCPYLDGEWNREGKCVCFWTRGEPRRDMVVVGGNSVVCVFEGGVSTARRDTVRSARIALADFMRAVCHNADGTVSAASWLRGISETHFRPAVVRAAARHVAWSDLGLISDMIRKERIRNGRAAF